MNKILDAYNLRARLSPALLAFLPLLFGGMAWFPDLKGTAAPLSGLAGSAGVVYFLIAFAREAGKKAEGRLVREWDGMPSVIMLRHRDESIDHVTKARYHAVLQGTVEGISLPSAEAELEDPAAADAQYRSCCAYLLAQTRDDKKFPLVKEENIGYGFRRNLYGLRSLALPLSVAGIVLSVGKIYVARAEGLDANVWPGICLAGSVMCLVAWGVVVNAYFVRSGADAYARRLLEAIEQI